MVFITRALPQVWGMLRIFNYNRNPIKDPLLGFGARATAGRVVSAYRFALAGALNSPPDMLRSSPRGMNLPSAGDPGDTSQHASGSPPRQPGAQKGDIDALKDEIIAHEAFSGHEAVWTNSADWPKRSSRTARALVGRGVHAQGTLFAHDCSFEQREAL